MDDIGYKTPLKIGYLGPIGTYSEVIALYLCEQQGGCCELIPYPTIDAVIRAVADGRLDQGIAPIENSIEGSINVTLDILAHDVDLYIQQEIVLPIGHHLLQKNEPDAITAILSHAQPLAQCRNYLAAHYPQARLEAVESTAKAAALVAAGPPGYAAIGSARASELHKLKIIDSNIQDCDRNSTRFVLITPEITSVIIADKEYKTSIVCQMNGERPGSLCDYLLEFAKRKVNLTKIESRPARTALGEYIFFFDIEGGLHQPAVAEAVAAIREKSLRFKNLGSYWCSQL